MPRFDRRHTDDLISYVTKATSPYHAVTEAAGILAAAGFEQAVETEEWNRRPGGKYMIRAGALVAWYVPESATASTGFRVFVGHTDSPTLKVKPKPDTGTAGWRQIAVEIYGGVPHDTWLDRDLGLSGRLVTRDGTPHLVQINRPLLRLPRIAIHLDRGVNDGQVLNAQDHMAPVWGLGEPDEGELIAAVAPTVGLDPADVVGWDLVVHDVQPPAYLGKDDELLACPRLDNLVSVHAGAAALASIADRDTDHIPVLAVFDHEETGSESYTGAGGPILDTVLRRVLAGRGAGVEDTARAFADSIVMSSDTTHAVHPNYTDRHEPGHQPLAGGGPTLKINSNQRYASEGLGTAVFAEACDRAGVPWQTYVNRNSLPCGTTVGPITAAKLGMLTVDVGIPILSMHSSRELCAADDPPRLAELAAAFFTG